MRSWIEFRFPLTFKTFDELILWRELPLKEAYRVRKVKHLLRMQSKAGKKWRSDFTISSIDACSSTAIVCSVTAHVNGLSSHRAMLQDIERPLGQSVSQPRLGVAVTPYVSRCLRRRCHHVESPLAFGFGKAASSSVGVDCVLSFYYCSGGRLLSFASPVNPVGMNCTSTRPKLQLPLPSLVLPQLSSTSERLRGNFLFSAAMRRRPQDAWKGRKKKAKKLYFWS